MLYGMTEQGMHHPLICALVVCTLNHIYFDYDTYTRLLFIEYMAN